MIFGFIQALRELQDQYSAGGTRFLKESVALCLNFRDASDTADKLTFLFLDTYFKYLLIVWAVLVYNSANISYVGCTFSQTPGMQSTSIRPKAFSTPSLPNMGRGTAQHQPPDIVNLPTTGEFMGQLTTNGMAARRSHMARPCAP